MKVKGLFATFITVILLGIFFLLSLPYVKGEKDLLSSEKASVAAKSDDEQVQKKEKYTAARLERAIKKQELYAVDAKYVVLHDEFKSLYPDNLQATIKNNTDKDIKDVQYGFIAWDKNGLPIKIKGDIDFGKSYFRGVTADAANIKGYGTFGEDKGYRIDSTIGVHSFKPFVVSYVDFEGKKWTNPLYKDFLKMYQGKRLKDIKDAEKYIFFKDKSPQTENNKTENIDPEKYNEISQKIKEKSEISSEALEEYIAYLQLMGLLSYLEYYESQNNIDINQYYDLSEENINHYTENDFTDYEDSYDYENSDDYYDDSYVEDELLEEEPEEYYEEDIDDSYEDSYYDEETEETYDESEVSEEDYYYEEYDYSEDVGDEEYLEEEY
ncbi:DUF5780 domain-containing protein [Macrococcus epidermidis]|uniref:DUF5780 domain-containing protein n=1 Tax=Macrococcus epidermidis TaxID=1902580 RepID=UPI001EF3D11E|nr:DUF5780 domain-containing protein [Macrococcus epidermidis]MCG7420959.1 DUF5780 domain-containing protein [Macrococcus epidermidis]